MAAAIPLTVTEAGALALADAAKALDHATDADTFLGALEHNRRVWTRIGEMAAARSWPVPDRRQIAYALKTTSQAKGGGSGGDDRIHALIDINHEVSRHLAAGHDIARIRDRAHAIWEGRGRPDGCDLEHWLLAEMELLAQ